MYFREGDIMLKLDRTVTCCFSGYRPHKFHFELKQNNRQFIELENRVTNAVLEAYSKGYRIFLCGGAMGFDLVCGEIVALLKEKFSDIHLFCFLPFKAQARSFPEEWKSRYNFVLSCADDIFYSCEHYTQYAFAARNRAMVDTSSMLITYFSGREGGTAHTVALAQSLNLEVVNLYESNNQKYENLTYYIGH